MAIKLSTQIRDAMGNAIISNFRNSAKLYILESGVPIGSVMNSYQSIILSEHNINSTTPATMSNGVMEFNTITEDTQANKTGNATHACIATSAGNVIATMTVSGLGGGGDLQMNTTSIVQGGPVRFTSLSWTMPAA